MNLLHLLIFKGSRKMGLALWLFITANVYLWVKLITADMWMNCILLVSVLTGGGTLLDRYLENKKPPTHPQQ